MNTPNPLLPQGALPPRVASSLYFKILMIFAVHIVVLGGILMVGCNDSSKNRAKVDQSTDLGGGPAKVGPHVEHTPRHDAPACAPRSARLQSIVACRQ